MARSPKIAVYFCLALLFTPAFGLGTGEITEQIVMKDGARLNQSPDIEGSKLPTYLDDLDTGIEDLELTQVFSYTRHGINIGFTLYQGEYSPFLIDTAGPADPVMTPVGLAQCWSIGRQLAISNPEFVQDAMDRGSYLLNMIQMQKNIDCNTQIYYGMINYVPYLGIFTESVVEEAMTANSNCHNCPEESLFPYAMSQTYTEDPQVTMDLDTDQVEMHLSTFLDYDDECAVWSKFECSNYPEISDRDYEILLEVAGIPHIGGEIVIKSIHKHLYHKLALNNGLERLSQELVDYSAKNLDGATECWVKSITSVEEFDWGVQALFARSLIDDLLRKITNPVDDINIYVTHDNNLMSLLVYLFGPVDDIEFFTPYYGSTVQLNVYYSPSVDRKYVELVYNTEPLQLHNCPAPCGFDDFVSILESYQELGMSPKEFCEIE